MTELRSCGTCQACCVAIGVRPLDKMPGERCRHQCVTGCSIYQAKPKECTDYQCWYLQGVDIGRPDKCGVIIDLIDTGIPGMDKLCVRELVPGAWKRPENVQGISNMASLMVVFILRADGSLRTVLGPPNKVQPFLDKVKKKVNPAQYSVSELRTSRES